jgi:hypothetical protein
MKSLLPAAPQTVPAAVSHVRSEPKAAKYEAKCDAECEMEREDECSLRGIKTQLLRYIGDDYPATVPRAISAFLFSARGLPEDMRAASRGEDTDLLHRYVSSQ